MPHATSPVMQRGASCAPIAWLATACTLCCALAATADNAGFAIAPKTATLAVDARGIADLLEGERGMLLRPVVEAFAGADAVATLDKLAKRASAPGERVAREVFAGRVAFFLPDASTDSAWLLGFESDDARCEHLIKMFGAKMVVPGRFDSTSEHLAMRRVGGWLLVAPMDANGRATIDAAAARVPVEDASTSLLGEPLLQNLLGSDAPVRMFLRHAAPLGGATTIAMRGEKRGLHLEVSGEYESPPMGLAPGHHSLDAHLVRAFEDRAVLVLSNPANGIPSRSDGFWVALMPEIVPPPAMRANLEGERVFFVGISQERRAPALACAWRVEDAEQAEADQDHFMRGICCGMTRSVETPRSDQKQKEAVQEGTPATKTPATQESAPRQCAELGAFADRYLGTPLKLGESVLCWRTVATPCGGWQVYSSDPRWLSDVSDGLKESSCSEDERPRASGIGFCDGPRAAAMLRRWQPLVQPGVNDRVARGLGALAEILERLGRIRFRYEMPSQHQVRATLEVEPLGRLNPQPRRTLDAAQGAQK